MESGKLKEIQDSQIDWDDKQNGAKGARFQTFFSDFYLKSGTNLEFQIDTFANALQKYNGEIGLGLNITFTFDPPLVSPQIPEWINIF